VRRVAIRTDARNERSRRAIEAVGTHFDGVLRAARIAADGGMRDMAVLFDPGYRVAPAQGGALREARLLEQSHLMRSRRLLPALRAL